MSIEYYKMIGFKYGIIMLCFLMETYQAESKETECQLILDAMNEINDTSPSLVLPKKYSYDFLYILLKRMTGREGYYYLKNFTFYADIIDKEIKENG